jgi:hypothetical protein
MGHQIIRQPDGRYAVFGTVTDTIVVWDATREEILAWFADAAAQRARDTVERLLTIIDAPDGRRAYHQFTKTWEQALDEDRANGGDASRYFREGK